MGRHVEQPPVLFQRKIRRSLHAPIWVGLSGVLRTWKTSPVVRTIDFGPHLELKAECALLLRPILESSVALGLTRKGGPLWPRNLETKTGAALQNRLVKKWTQRS